MKNVLFMQCYLLVVIPTMKCTYTFLYIIMLYCFMMYTQYSIFGFMFRIFSVEYFILNL